MSTSGATTSVWTARDVVKRAMGKLGEISAMAEPKAADMQLGVESLNAMLKDWQNDGVNLWRMADYELTWPADTQFIDLIEDDDHPSILDVIDLAWVDAGSYERAIWRTELADYSILPNKAQSGNPTLFCVTPNPTPGVQGVRLRLWPVPSAATDLRGTVNRVIEDVTSPNDNLDIPQAYHMTAIMCLAAYMAPDFNKENEKAGVIAEARRLYRIMRANDRPASYFFEGAASHG